MPLNDLLGWQQRTTQLQNVCCNFQGGDIVEGSHVHFSLKDVLMNHFASQIYASVTLITLYGT